MDNKSFTLIELVFVIVLMVILALTGAIAQFRSYDALKLDAAAQRIATDIRSAQELVMDYSTLAAFGTAGARRIIVDFEETSCAANSYCLQTSPRQIITNPVTGQPWRVNINTEFPGVTISSVNLAQGGYSTLFFRSPLGETLACAWEWDGSSCQWEHELFSDPGGGTITLTYQGKTKTIRISQVTGRVSIE